MTIVKDVMTPVALTMNSTIDRVEIGPAAPEVSGGGTVTLTATPRDAAGEAVLITPGTLRWATSAAAVATVDAAGGVSGVSAGTATITVTEIESGKTGTAIVTVRPAPTPTPTPSPTPIPVPDGAVRYNPANGHYYESVRLPNQITWRNARTAAEGRAYRGVRGHLVTVTSAAEMAFVAQSFGADGSSWIGASQDTAAPDYAEPRNGWRWVTGEAWEYTNWSPGEPNNVNPREDFALLARAEGTWNDSRDDAPSDMPRGYLVEYDTPPGPTPTPSPTPSPTPTPGGAITFAAPQTYSVPAAADLVTGDYDADGNADVLVGSGRHLMLLFGRGDGTLEAARIVFSLPAGATANPAQGGEFIDVDKDGRPDIVCKDLTDRVYILTNSGDRAFAQAASVSFGVQPVNAVVGDFDADGWQDIAVTVHSGGVSIVKNQNGTAFARTDSYSVPGIAQGLTLADLNGDGRPDLIPSFAASPSGFLILLGNAQGKFTVGARNNTTGQNATWTTVADFNRDGKPDIAVNNYWDGNIGVLAGNGNGTFQQQTTYAHSPFPLLSRAADFNGDGWPDIVSANAGTATFGILRNQGAGIFAARAAYASGGNNTRTLAIADFNEDGKPDIVFGCEGSGVIAVHLNTSP